MTKKIVGQYVQDANAAYLRSLRMALASDFETALLQFGIDHELAKTILSMSDAEVQHLVDAPIALVHPRAATVWKSHISGGEWPLLWGHLLKTK